MVNAPCSIQTKRPQFVPGAFLRLRFPAERKPFPKREKPTAHAVGFLFSLEPHLPDQPQRHALAGHPSGVAVDSGVTDQWNCSSSVEPVRAFTLDEPPWITVVTSSK